MKEFKDLEFEITMFTESVVTGSQNLSDNDAAAGGDDLGTIW